MPISVEDAVRVMKAFFLPAVERVREDRANDRLLVSSALRTMWVCRRETIDREQRPSGYELFAANEYVHLPGRGYGVARLPDGRMFLLDEEDQLRAFLAALGRPLDPVELATLVITYQGGRGQAPPQRRLMSHADLAKVVDDEGLRAVTEFIPFQAIRRDDGAMVLDLCAYTIGKSPLLYNPIEVTRWHIEVPVSGAVEWSFRTVATDLRWRPH